MSEETGLYDKITIGGETFRRWDSSTTIEVMQDGVWTSIPYVAQRAILAMIENMDAAVAAEREACAKIAEKILNRQGYGGLAAQHAAWDGIPAAIRARGQTT